MAQQTDPGSMGPKPELGSPGCVTEPGVWPRWLGEVPISGAVNLARNGVKWVADKVKDLTSGRGDGGADGGPPGAPPGGPA
jgi:hypothetical protein